MTNHGWQFETSLHSQLPWQHIPTPQLVLQSQLDPEIQMNNKISRMRHNERMFYSIQDKPICNVNETYVRKWINNITSFIAAIFFFKY